MRAGERIEEKHSPARTLFRLAEANNASDDYGHAPLEEPHRMLGPSTSVLTPNDADQAWATVEILCAPCVMAPRMANETTRPTITMALIRHSARTSCTTGRDRGILARTRVPPASSTGIEEGLNVFPHMQTNNCSWTNYEVGPSARGDDLESLFA